MSVFGWVVSVFLFILLIIFFVPFFVRIDSERKIFFLRWHLFTLAVDFSDHTTVIGFAGIHYRKKAKSEPPPPSGAAPSPPAEEERGKPGGSSLLRLVFSRRSLLILIVQRIVRYVIDLLRSFSVRKLFFDFSSDDPVINGICYGAIQGVEIKKVVLSVNFWGENRFVGRFSLMLYRTVVPTLRFLIRLPYRELYRFYKEMKAMRRGGLSEEAGSAPTPS